MSDSETSVAPPSALSPQSIPWPPGNAGQVADFIYKSAPRPNNEVAIAGTLGLLAGICGRQWQVSNTGLNLYLILVARSATGKEAMISGISALINAAAKYEPRVVQFVEFSDFASGPALVKACVGNHSFVNVGAEWGHKFSELADRKSSGPMTTLRRAMTDLYMKSGVQSMTGGIAYSNRENNIASAQAVSYSMLGETTPSSLYEAITPSMMADGFMSRFTIIQYHGDRPEENPAPQYEPSPGLANGVAQLARHACDLYSRNAFQNVDIDGDGKQLTDAFKQECDQQIRKAGDDESRRQMYNRAHLKALRIAALLAVVDNCFAPSVTTAHAAWAIALVRADIATFNARLESGDVGDDDAARKNKVIAVAIEYLKTPPPKYTALRDAYLIPDQYLQTRTQNLTAFKSHPLGANKALKLAIESLVDGGQLQKAMPAEVSARVPKARGVCYYLTQIPGVEQVLHDARTEDMMAIAARIDELKSKAAAEHAARNAK
jgi:hypothetical protein